MKSDGRGLSSIQLLTRQEMVSAGGKISGGITLSRKQRQLLTGLIALRGPNCDLRVFNGLFNTMLDAARAGATDWAPTTLVWGVEQWDSMPFYSDECKALLVSLVKMLHLNGSDLTLLCSLLNAVMAAGRQAA